MLALAFTGPRTAKIITPHRNLARYEQRILEVAMPQPTQLHDVVALLVDLNEHGLRRGQVGTIVETLAPDVYEVEFSNDEGRTYAMCAVRADQLMVLHYHAAAAS
jgi:hypothetical protein